MFLLYTRYSLQKNQRKELPNKGNIKMTNSELSKLVAETGAAVITIMIVITLISELSIQSDIIKSLSFLFYGVIIAAIIAVLFNYVRYLNKRY